jgi:hypothetical protein
MSHADTADNLLIKPTAGARPASPRTLGRFIRKARTRGLTPDESRTPRTTPGWQRPLTDRLNESHGRLKKRGWIWLPADEFALPPESLLASVFGLINEWEAA